MFKNHLLAGVRDCYHLLGLCMVASLAFMEGLSAADYYIDPAGNDSNAGTSQATPWQSLGKVNGTVFQPGDKMLFKRGGTWVGTLSPQGSGNSSAQITLGAYGDGAKPLINGNGNWAVITLSSQSYWTIDGFEVTNPAGNDSSRSGIRVDWSGSGTMRGIQILNNDVHDVRGIKNVNDGGRNNGGIFFWINEPGKADGVLIQGNTVKTIHGQGIAFNAEAEYMGGGMNYANCSPNVVARGNTVLSTSGDGILMLGTDNELVEFNEVGYVGQLSDWYNNIAAAWPTRHVNGLWQYNHVHHTAALNANDSTAFDNDGFVKGATVFQYNYTHDNAGGFLMEYTWGGDDPSAQTIARYNISWNESRILASNRNSARIYNNVFYNPGATIDVSWTPNPSYVLFSNNLFVAAGRSAEFSRQLFMNNSFSGGVTRPVTIDGNLTRDPQFVSPNTTGNLAGFILQAGSAERNSGFVIVGNGGLDFWGATLPSTAPHRGASQINSIANYTVTPAYARLEGPDSIEIPASGTNTATFVPIVRDQNFRRIASPSVTWSVSPAIAGVSINSSGTLSVASSAMPKRLAVQAASGGSVVGTYTVTLTSTHPLTYTWGGGNSVWTDTSATGWNTGGSYPVNGDTAIINSGQVSTTANDQTTGINFNIGGGTLNSGNVYMRVDANTTLQGGTIIMGHSQAYNQGWFGGALGGTITVSGSAASSITGGSYTGQDINMGTLTTFDVGNVTTGTDLTVSLKLTDYFNGSWLSSSLVKTGSGTLALTSTNNYAGSTTVSNGVLDLTTGIIYRYAGWANRSITINNGGTVKVSNWGDGNADTAGGFGPIGFGAGNILLDNGTLVYVGGAASGNMDRSFTIGAGGATLVSNGSATWQITDTGRGFALASSGGTLTLSGSSNGLISKAIGGVSGLTKSGVGTWTLSGANTYSGNTTISAGTLELTSTSQMQFVVTDAPASNQITGAGTATFDGVFNINTSAASGATGHIWLLVDRASLNGESFGSNFSVAGFTPQGDGVTWTMSDSRGIWSFFETTGVLTLDIGNDYDSWKTANGVTGGKNDDDDSDGLSNFAEYAFGLDPSSGSSSSPYLGNLSSATGIFTYTRRKASLSGLAFTIWTSTNLIDWTEDTGAAQNVTTIPGTERESVDVTLSPGFLNADRLFVRLSAD